MVPVRYKQREGGLATGDSRLARADGQGPGSDALSRATLAGLEDGALLVHIASGDQQAFRVLAGRHLSPLLAVARRMLRSDGEADDIVQEALIRLWRHAPTLETGPHGVRPWLRRVVANLCLDHMRRHRLSTVMAEPPEEAEPARQVQGLEERDLTRRVAGELDRLPERQRLALTLFHYEGLSQSEVGDMLGISEEAVESLLARARRSLKAALKEEWRTLLPDLD